MKTFRKLKSVTRNLFKLSNNNEYYFKFQEPIFLGKKIGDKDPAHLANVINLETGEEGQIILGAVLVGILNENYPDDAYVSRCFEIVKFRDAASAYNTYNVSEVADPSEDDEIEAEAEAEAEAPAPSKRNRR